MKFLFYFSFLFTSFSISASSRGAADPCDELKSAHEAYSNCRLAEDLEVKKGLWSKRIKSVDDKLSVDGKKALVELRKRAEKYFNLNSKVTHFASEGGTGYNGMVSLTRIELNEKMVVQLEAVEKKTFSKTSDEEVTTADKELNQSYSKSIAKCRSEEKTWGTKFAFGRNCNTVQAMQLAWIPYRDAWITFYKTSSAEKNEPRKIEAATLREFSKEQADFFNTLDYE